MEKSKAHEAALVNELRAANESIALLRHEVEEAAKARRPACVG